MRGKYIFIFLILNFLVLKNAYASTVGDNKPVSKVYHFSVNNGLKLTATVTKYCSLCAGVLCGIKACKKACKSFHLLCPAGTDLKLSDLIKYPLNLILRFPCKVCGTVKYSALSVSFFAIALLLYRLGF